jgi:8-oxo-dGTP diphosphatase
MPRILLVTAAVLYNSSGEVLLGKRPEHASMPGLWEFPGGKLEEGERPEEGLCRELREELGIHTRVEHLEPLQFASHAYADFHLLMPCFLCRHWEGTPEPQWHDQLAWVAPQNLGEHSAYPMPEADYPLIPSIQAWWDAAKILQD